MIPKDPFEDLLKIRDYRNHEQIECLMCGKNFLRLTSAHLRTHQMTADDYRARFGIPWTYSLTSTTSRENSRKQHKPVNQANLTHRRQPGDRTDANRAAPLAAKNYWKDTIRPQGPKVNAQVREIVPCDDCGVDVPTTKLTKVHGTRCQVCRVIAKEKRDQAKAAALLPRCA